MKCIVKKNRQISIYLPGVMGMFFLFLSPLGRAQTLNAGDFAVVGLNSSFNLNTTSPIGPDEIAIVALANIPSGTNIKITDRGWNGSAMITGLTGEGVMSWTTTSAIPQGTVFKITVTTGVSPSISISPSSYGTPAVTADWTTPSLVGAMGNTGDQVIIYQGSDTNPGNFVYGFNSSNSTATSAGNWQTGSISARDSDLPPGLTNNSALDGSVAATAVAFTYNGGYFANNFVYSGSRAGTKTSLLKAIANRANWTYTTTLATTYNLSVGGTYFTGSNPAFSLTTLPLGLRGFSGSNTPTGYALQWQVAGEENFNYYDIEKSTDGRLFQAIGRVPGTGSPVYHFTVDGALSQQSYYRLKMTDRDAAYTYSPVIALSGNEEKAVLRVYPNPASDWITINSGRKIQEVTFVNMQGQTMLRVVAGGQQVESIPIQQLRAGSYFVHIKTATGMLTDKLLKR